MTYGNQVTSMSLYLNYTNSWYQTRAIEVMMPANRLSVVVSRGLFGDRTVIMTLIIQ